MSDSEDALNDPNRPSAVGGRSTTDKRRRTARACDNCRRRKTKCDGATRCSACKAVDMVCVYLEWARKPIRPKGYMEAVETRLSRAEAVLRQLLPNTNLDPYLGSAVDRYTFESASYKQLDETTFATTALPADVQASAQPFVSDLQSAGLLDLHPQRPTKPLGPAIESDDEEEALQRGIDSLILDTLVPEQDSTSFVGLSSGINLAKIASDFKYGSEQSHSTLAYDLSSSRRPLFWSPPDFENIKISLLFGKEIQSRDFWPKPELAAALIDNYFSTSNVLLPLLHRPTFQREFDSGLYLSDRNFLSLTLAVFAHGARLSDDPSVYADQDKTKSSQPFSKGWPFVHAFFGIVKSWHDSCRLYELQAIILIASFQGSCTHPRSMWTMLGIAIRAAIDAGFHRKHIIREMPPAKAELAKRAFWCLFVLDRATSGFVGRPVGLHDEDHDVEYPLDVDDEFWENEDPALCFVQPAGVPCQISSFISLIRLYKIVGYCLRTVFAISKSRLSLSTAENQRAVVSELDSLLNGWLARLPLHLKWDPHHKNMYFFHQSVQLYCTFYAIQIHVHRTFLPSVTKSPQVGFPSLAMCINAARSGTHILETARKRGEVFAIQLHLIPHAFTFGFILLINVWVGVKTTAGVGDFEMSTKDAKRIITLLDAAEKFWLSAGKLKDILVQLSLESHLPVKLPTPSASLKHARDDNVEAGSPGFTSESSSPFTIAAEKSIREASSYRPRSFVPDHPSTLSPHQRQCALTGSSGAGHLATASPGLSTFGPPLPTGFTGDLAGLSPRGVVPINSGSTQTTGPDASRNDLVSSLYQPSTSSVPQTPSIATIEAGSSNVSFGFPSNPPSQHDRSIPSFSNTPASSGGVFGSSRIQGTVRGERFGEGDSFSPAPLRTGDGVGDGSSWGDGNFLDGVFGALQGGQEVPGAMDLDVFFGNAPEGFADTWAQYNGRGSAWGEGT